MKVFSGWFGHEGNMMSAHLAQFEDEKAGLTRGQEVIDKYRGTPDYVAGIIQCAEENGVELVMSIHKEIAAPRLSTDCLNRFMAMVMEDLTACKDEIEGICFVIHGAGCAEGIDDLETYVLREFRKVVGPDMPITVPMDLHGNISQDMVKLGQGFYTCKEYPHNDQAEAGYRAMKQLLEIIRTGVRPEVASVHIPMLVPAMAGYTLGEPLLSVNNYIKKYAEDHGLIDAGLFHGFPYADAACCGSSIMVVAKEGAQKAAEELADYVWSQRERFRAKLTFAPEAFDIAENYEGEGYVLLAEPSDNPGGGAPGDGTHLLREMLARDIPGSVFDYICDPEAAEILVNAGVGAKVDVLLGGKVEPTHGEPVDLKGVEVLAVSDGKMISNSPMMMGIERSAGPCARIRTGNCEIIVGTLRRQTMDDRLFVCLGTVAENYRIVCIKSANHYKAFFRDHAAMMIAVETKGIHSGDLTQYNYVKTPRPIFPIDEVGEWHAGE
ncbi:MAG: M81 family metallopeptidase [Firmicutes bacterium]|nr:M81 family metallopeptidase [Bacillota bacterium]